MYCDSKESVNRSSARSATRVRRSALHRPDPRRPHPIYATVSEVSVHFAWYDRKPRWPSN